MPMLYLAINGPSQQGERAEYTLEYAYTHRPHWCTR